MRPWILLFTFTAFCSGCTHVALERRTVKQASTITDLQYQQVLDNLAMFASNKDAMAWHVNLKGGTIQLTDQASAGFSAMIPSAVSDQVKAIFTPSVGGQRNIVNQWEVDPVTDTDALESLQFAYQVALDPDSVDEKEILKKICDLSIRFDVLPKKETIKIILRLEEKEENASRCRERRTPPCEDKKCEDKKTPPGIEVTQSMICKIRADIQTIDTEILELEQAIKQADDLLKGREVKAKDTIDIQSHKLKWKRKKSRLADEKNFKRTQETVFCDLLKECGNDKKRSTEPRAARNAPPRTPSSRRQARESRDSEALFEEESDTMLLILTAMHAACPAGYLPKTDNKWETERNPALIDAAEDKIKKLEDLLDPNSDIRKSWVSVATSKKDVPKCACYVGHYHGCNGDCYVWVMPDKLDTLRDFTLMILDLAAPSEPEIPRLSAGPVFSPALR